MTNEIPSINAGSMADIAFLLLVFFLVTTTMESDLGLQRNMAPIEEEMPPQEYDERNVFEIKINAFNQILAENNSLEIGELSEAIKQFILNPNNSPQLSESRTLDIPGFGPASVSKQVITIKSDNSTSYETYIEVQDEIAQAYNQLRDEFSRTNWGMTYAFLQENEMDEQLAILNQVYPFNISEDEAEDVLALDH